MMLKQIPQIIIGTVFICGFIYVLVLVFRGDVTIPEEQREMVIYLLGILSGGMGQVMNFFFGSSSGSKDKNPTAR